MQPLLYRWHTRVCGSKIAKIHGRFSSYTMRYLVQSGRGRGFGFGLGLTTLLFLCLGVAAQQQLPACATQCTTEGLVQQNTCGFTDIHCICTNQALIDTVGKCILASCTKYEALAAKNVSATLCGDPVRNRGPVVPIVGAVSLGVTFVAVAIRVTMTGGTLAADDYLAVAAFLASIPMVTFLFIATDLGLGQDIWAIRPQNISRILLSNWITVIFFLVSLTLTKLSFLFFLLRIFPAKSIRRTVYCYVVVICAHGTAFCLAHVLACRPVSFFWRGWNGMTGGKCIDYHSYAWALGVTNIVLDLASIAVPIPQLFKLALSTKKKIYVIMMFSVGIFGTVVAAIRLQTFSKFATTQNPTYDNVTTAYWSIIETYVGIFCVCMPALRHLLVKLFPQWLSNSHANSNYGHYDYGGKSNRSAIKSGNRGTGSYNLSRLGSSGITKTLETRVESELGEDDETGLVKSESPSIAMEDWDRRESGADAKSSQGGARASHATPATLFG